MSVPWRALVLGGGGSTGEFQVGALPVLCRSIERFDFHAGVGVGALHATLLAQYPDSFAAGVEVLLSLWKRFGRQRDVLDAPFGGAAAGTLATLASTASWARDGVYGNRTLRRLVDEYCAWERLVDHKNWGIEVTSLTDGQLYSISNDEMLTALRNVAPRTLRPLKHALADAFDDAFLGRLLRDFIAAAGSVPFMLPPVDILGHRFVEGGLRDFLPLELAVAAFELARKSEPDLEPTFYVLDNYTAEIQPETADMLDSGQEIMLRAIKIMTVEMAQNDIQRGRDRLAALGAKAVVHELRPRVDFRLHPLNFDDHERRQKMRDEGATVAALAFPGVDRAFDEAVQALAGDPSDADAATRIVRTVRGRAAPIPEAMVPMGAATVVAPRNLDDLLQIMRRALHERKRLKAVGGRNAFSRVAESDGLQLDLKASMNTITPVEDALLKDPALAPALVEIEAGATIEAIDAWLWARGRTLVNQPGWEELTFVGVALSGGHGSGVRHPALSESIRALHLAHYDADGRVVHERLEPTNGITDPAKWQARMPRTPLVQDDARFHAATVSFGTLGVVTSVVVDTQPAFFLEERRALVTWSDVKALLPGLLADPGVHSVHVWLNAYATHGDHRVVLSEYRPHAGPRRGHRGWGVTFGGVDELAPIILWLMKIAPKAVPTLLDASLRSTVPNGPPPVMPAYEALNFGTPNMVRVDPANIGVPTATIAQTIDALLALFAEHLAAPTPHYITCPIGLRFTPASAALLSPQHGRATTMIEMPFLKHTPGDLQTIRDVQALLYTQHEGRPHWGQVHDVVDATWMQKIFGARWDAFQKVHAELDPLGAFLNVQTRQLGLGPAT